MASLSKTEKDQILDHFLQLADGLPDSATATHFLEAYDYDEANALDAYFDSLDNEDPASHEHDADMEDDDDDDDDDDEDDLYADPPPRAIPTSGSAQQPSSQAANTSGSGPRKPLTGVRTLGDLASAQDHDDHDDEDSDHNNLYTGGEKSGLAVQGGQPKKPKNAKDRIEGLLDKARKNPERPDGDDPTPQTSYFGGRGVTLGGDDAPSQVIDAPPAPPAPPPRVRRTLHLWADGFSVDDGPLFRYDDPQNQHTLDMIHRGRAPIHLLNVEHGQEVDLELDVQKEVKYVVPKKKYVPFSGEGQRLGSPTPGVPSTAAATTGASAVVIPAVQAAPSSSSAPQVTVDSSQPMLRLQIRLGDGRRLQSQFNTTHTIGDVYGFVDQSSPGNTRGYVLATTFPNKDHDDKSVALADVDALKKGGVVVQKWK